MLTARCRAPRVLQTAPLAQESARAVASLTSSRIRSGCRAVFIEAAKSVFIERATPGVVSHRPSPFAEDGAGLAVPFTRHRDHARSRRPGIDPAPSKRSCPCWDSGCRRPEPCCTAARLHRQPVGGGGCNGATSVDLRRAAYTNPRWPGGRRLLDASASSPSSLSIGAWARVAADVRRSRHALSRDLGRKPRRVRRFNLTLLVHATAAPTDPLPAALHTFPRARTESDSVRVSASGPIRRWR